MASARNYSECVKKKVSTAWIRSMFYNLVLNIQPPEVKKSFETGNQIKCETD